MPDAHERPRRGRPRSEKARAAILDAALELFLERGLDLTSMDAIAEQAGVSKATIYRWWPNKRELAIDALYRDWDVALDLTGDEHSLRDELLVPMRRWIERTRERPYGRVLAALIAAVHTDPEFADRYRARFVESRRAPARALIERAIERGELPAAVDVDMALDLIYGPLYHRLLHRHAPLDENFVEAVMDTVLRGLTAAPGAVAKKSGRK